LALFTLVGILPIWHSLRWSSTNAFATGCGALSLLAGAASLEDDAGASVAELAGTVAELLERWRCPLELVASGAALLSGAEADEPATVLELDKLSIMTMLGPSSNAENDIEATDLSSSTALELDTPKSGVTALESPKTPASEESPA
jgi:hypothetical protein